MNNIVDQYTEALAVEGDEGVVAIEYVIVAAALVIALAGLWTAFGGQLAAALQDVVDSI